MIISENLWGKNNSSCQVSNRPEDDSLVWKSFASEQLQIAFPSGLSKKNTPNTSPKPVTKSAIKSNHGISIPIFFFVYLCSGIATQLNFQVAPKSCRKYEATRKKHEYLSLRFMLSLHDATWRMTWRCDRPSGCSLCRPSAP